jgi:DNA-directed RNA polymerase subunit RPC12/RpoP
MGLFLQPAQHGNTPVVNSETEARSGSEASTVAIKRDRGEQPREFPCKQCGASVQFAPGTRELVCPYCGHRDVIPTSAEEIREYGLDEALLTRPKAEGWGIESRSLRCEGCGATTVFAAGQTAGKCAFCGSAKVVEQAAREDLIRPESLVPFRIDRKQAVQRFRAWLSRLWFRPNDLKRQGQLAQITGAYLPFWTFDAFTTSWWTAEAGYHYYVTVEYQETDSQGNTVTRTRQEQRTRWEPASGHHAEFFDDELVCGSQGVEEGLAQAVCPYDLSELTSYEASYLAGFVAEEYQIDLGAAWERGRESIRRQLYQACASEVPGDTHRNLHVDTAFSQKMYRHVLLPLWIAAYQYNGRPYRFLVNGQTGEVQGEAPLSWWKITFAVLAALLVALILWLLFGQHQGG